MTQKPHPNFCVTTVLFPFPFYLFSGVSETQPIGATCHQTGGLSSSDSEPPVLSPDTHQFTFSARWQYATDTIIPPAATRAAQPEAKEAREMAMEMSLSLSPDYSSPSNSSNSNITLITQICDQQVAHLLIHPKNTSYGM